MRKVALVVGGGRSLGEYLSKHLAKVGYDVAIADLNEDNAKKVAEEIETEFGCKSVGYGCNAIYERQVISTVKAIENDFDRIDLLVYNAGVAVSKKITDFGYKDFKFIVDVNLNGYFLFAREVSKVMIAKGIEGRIIQINSKSGRVGSKHNSGYSAGKFAGVGLTQSLALDLAEHKITVNALMLGNLLDSDMFESLIPQYAVKLGIPESEVKQVYIDKVPLKRGCRFIDVANMLTFYASKEAEYCTGQSINITGGQVM
ncbi:TPA: sorbitol-6-phosphate dehydrogenase [Clostridioides difficile]|nr:sorbitol-6-phosphate dehydrogenase [Clostridioides difficile]MDI6157544.1 sorbitol-6-phosphate dehydrogenase [Clostridioides difficile]HBE9931763.1 sorbitol-6-phosphate dehydrogenase [Clostridioides difficile]